jgi:hypothetical protein
VVNPCDRRSELRCLYINPAPGLIGGATAVNSRSRRDATAATPPRTLREYRGHPTARSTRLLALGGRSGSRHAPLPAPHVSSGGDVEQPAAQIDRSRSIDPNCRCPVRRGQVWRRSAWVRRGSRWEPSENCPSRCPGRCFASRAVLVRAAFTASIGKVPPVLQRGH